MGKLGAVADGMAEDLIRSIQQLACTEGHYKTLIEKYNSELNNGIINTDDQEAVTAHIEKLDDAIQELGAVAELRRAIMLRLMNSYKNHDRSMWCAVKHLSVASYCAFEAYQASDDDGELLNLWLDANARLVKAVTRWLGVEITDCQSCFSDILKANNPWTSQASAIK